MASSTVFCSTGYSFVTVILFGACENEKIASHSELELISTFLT